MSTKRYDIEVLTNEDQLVDWTRAQFSSFVGTGNVLHDILFPVSYNTKLSIDSKTLKL